MQLVPHLKWRGAWFANAGAVIEWFRTRRAVRFTAQGCETSGAAPRGLPALTVREHRPGAPPRDVPGTANPRFNFRRRIPT